MAQKKSVHSFIARWWFTAKMAAHGILSNPLRSALTILGVAIGVASVVCLMGIGEGARLEVVKQFESLGTNVISINAYNPKYEFNPNYAAELVDRVQGMDLASPVVNAKSNMKWKRARGVMKLIGVNDQYPKIRDHKVIAGNFFTKWHVMQRSQVAVLGYNIGTQINGGRTPIGRCITLNGMSYRIIGVLDKKGDGNANDVDNKVVIPYTSAMKIAEKTTVEEIWGKADTPEDADLAVVQLSRIIKRKLGLDDKAPTMHGVVDETEKTGEQEGSGDAPVPAPKPSPEKEKPKKQEIPGAGEDILSITNLNKLVEEADTANRVMTLLLGGIAAVSLLVGGLGIMNIMLVAVTERTEEIGVRRALGAKKIDLLVQFLLEALFVSILGALAGVIAGIWGMKVFDSHGFNTAINLQSIKIAIVVALGSGLLFGVYPAMSASSVPPVEALRRQ